MNESVLQALMRLFAIVASVNKEGHARNERDVVVEYLQRQFSDELVNKYMDLYDQFIHEYHTDITSSESVNPAIRKDTIEELCIQLNRELEQPQKMFVLVFLLDYINKGEAIADDEKEFLFRVAEYLRINPAELDDSIAFTFDQIQKVKNKADLLFIDSKPAPKEKKIKHLFVDKIHGRIKVLHISSTNTYVLRYDGNQILTLNGHRIKVNRSYIWALGSVIKNPHFGSVYYTWVAGKFIQAKVKSSFVFKAENIEFSYGNSPNGIKRFNLNEESGRLIGIIGGSGSGKSTLLKVLSGVIKPKSGRILINGYDIHKNSDLLRGVAGYVPQDDFLIKELTVFENLYLNARLCYSHYSQEQLNQLVDEALLNFDLVEARNLSVGDAFNKYLSGGQRKRLNIALELIREPSVLFVDEPTSGLSSADSEKVMNLLKRQTFKGKLVFANIHQPSAEIFRLFDKLLVVDQGGRVVYYGNPLDAINYFKRASGYVDADESECLSCGNIDVDQILRNVEARVVDVNGRLTRKRKTSPEEWYKAYMDKIDPIIQQIQRPFTTTIPESLYKIPERWRQMKVFFYRDLLAKFKNQQYLTVTLLEAPVLALILSFYTRSSRDASGFMTDYSFGLNANLPSYLFMAVIVSLFLGLVVSAEEIFRDRKLLERERFLSLSRLSYLSSKTSILFIISAVQMFLFVLIGNRILDIDNMSWRYFLILFSSACWANIIGMNISSGFKSIVTIYILVPLILVPQLLFSGVVVDFQNLHKAIYSGNSVPGVGDAMTSRWAYEAIVVTQFKDNSFSRDIFCYDREINHSMFKKAYVIPELNGRLKNIEQNIRSGNTGSSNMQDIQLVRNEVNKISSDLGIKPPEYLTGDMKSFVTTDDLYTTGHFLDSAWSVYHRQYIGAIADRENILGNKYGGDKKKYLRDRRKYANEKLESLVLNDKELVEYIVYKNEIVRLKNSIYTKPFLTNGRSHFYSSYKNLFGLKIDTFWYNILVIWASTILWFGLLYFDLLRKLITYFENIKLQRFNTRILKILKQYESKI
jgi:ABC transport system ATP-binding/permease protein